MGLPNIVITGASGFVGRLLLDEIKESFHVYAFARRSQTECGAPEHPNIEWIQVDIGEVTPLTTAFEKIRDQGGAEALVHLAAYYDFTGEDNPEYKRTNVIGLRNILELSLMLSMRRFIFASSVAACPFPPPGQSIDETTAPLGNNVYARSKMAGEALIQDYRDQLPSCIVRFAALYSDWCEYPPLFSLLSCWFANGWNAQMLGGSGNFAIPYMHVRCAVSFLKNLLHSLDGPEPGEVFIASPNGAISQRELFDAATFAYFGERRKPTLVPKLFTRVWLHLQDRIGKIIGKQPFERPWMGRYLDRQLYVNADRSRRRLEWAIRPRFELLRRIPFLVENFRTRPVRWNEINHAAMKKEDPGYGLMIHYLLEQHQETICLRQTNALLHIRAHDRFGTYHHFDFEELSARVRTCIQNLRQTIRTREMEPVGGHCREVARERFRENFTVDEVIAAFACLGRICIGVLCEDQLSVGLEQALTDRITMAVQFCIDEIQDEFEILASAGDESSSCLRRV
ncbi:MAG: NAD-dependent epimerase/dehydratase family protein [Thermoanaerobaculales bacterium]|nr:NAD-dependent epimerase/dehydratase family protein [Thermoanaerobaculales bacterium]